MDTKGSYTTIDEYIALFPPDVQARLNQLRAAIKAAAPEASEKISYAMPTFFLAGNLVHFGAHTSHIGFYPTPSGMEQFKSGTVGVSNRQGSAQFPLDQPLPLDLVTRIVKFRVAENLAAAAAKAKKRK